MATSNRIRVLYIIARMNVGGPAILVADHIRNLSKSEFDTRLITGYCDDNESDYLDVTANDIEAIRIPGFGRSISLWRDIKAFFLVIREIIRFKPNIIHTHTAKAGVIGRIAGLIARPTAKRIHTFHGHLLHGYFGPIKVRLIIALEKVLGLITFRFIAIGNKVKIDLVNAGIGIERKFDVIFPGLQDLDRHEKFEARKSLNLDADKKYIVFIGRLTQIKRPDRLIELGRSIKVDYPSAQILVAGAGEMLENLTEITNSESLPITFLGWRSDVGMILSASNIAILCSDNEGIPLTLIQASQAGLPIVTTNVGSVKDIVVDGVTGLLTDVSSEGLIKAVYSLLSDPMLGEKLGKSGEERARKYFSLDAMISQHERLYSQCP